MYFFKYISIYYCLEGYQITLALRIQSKFYFKCVFLFLFRNYSSLKQHIRHHTLKYLTGEFLRQVLQFNENSKKQSFIG